MERRIRDIIIESCRNDYIYEIMDMIEYKKLDVHKNDEYIFRIACECGFISLVKHLIEYTEKYNHRINIYINDFIVFRTALSKGHYNILVYLIYLMKHTYYLDTRTILFGWRCYQHKNNDIQVKHIITFQHFNHRNVSILFFNKNIKKKYSCNITCLKCTECKSCVSCIVRKENLCCVCHICIPKKICSVCNRYIECNKNYRYNCKIHKTCNNIYIINNNIIHGTYKSNYTYNKDYTFHLQDNNWIDKMCCN